MSFHQWKSWLNLTAPIETIQHMIRWEIYAIKAAGRLVSLFAIWISYCLINSRVSVATDVTPLRTKPKPVSQCCEWLCAVESSWNVMVHGDGREGKWRGNWRVEWVASTLHTTSEHGVSNITTADARTSAASSRLNWRPRRFKLTRPFRRKTKSGFCACAITFQLASTTLHTTKSRDII